MAADYEQRRDALDRAIASHGTTEVLSTLYGDSHGVIRKVPNDPDKVVHAASVYLCWLREISSASDPVAEAMVNKLGAALDTLSDNAHLADGYSSSDVQVFEAARVAWAGWKANR